MLQLIRSVVVVLSLVWCGAATGGRLLAQESTGTNGGSGAVPARTVPMEITRLQGPITLDGRVDEPAWDVVPPLPMSMYSPVYLGSLTEDTEVRIAYDDQFLYVSGRLLESEPEQIRTNTFYRDQYSGDDLLAVVIDSYNDYETAVWFVTNPAGARQDRTVSNDAQFTGGMPMNADWNAHWDVVTRQDDEGWYAEFRIPFSTLGFQAVDDQVTMGLIVYRVVARKNERQVFPAIDPKWGGLGFAKPSQAQRIVLHGVRESKPFYVTPYSLGGIRQVPELRAPGSGPAGWVTESDPTREVGVDLKFSPTSNLALDLTVNTDFAQVEADDQQVNLTRFPLFFPEKRQFFQERASTFDFNTGGFTNRLFHSRRIGLDGGEIVRIYGGVRAVGRVGGTDVGLLTMQTASQDGIRPSENMGVLRLRQQVFNPYSTVGAMVTTRLGDMGQNNVAYGLDAVLRPMGNEYVTVRWAQTFDEAIDEGGALDAGLILARWERIQDDGLSYRGQYGRVGDDYLPRLGFQSRKDVTSYGGQVQYKRFNDADSPLRSTALRVNTEHFHRNADGRAESRLISPEYEIEFKGGAQLTAGLNYNFESLLQPFSISQVSVPAGDYWFHEGNVRLMLARSDNFRGEFSATAGRFYDGTRLGAALNPTWNASRHLELGAGYEINRLNFDERGEQTTVHLARLKVQIALNTRFSLSSLAQFASTDDLTTFNVRFRYHFREGTDLWFVYNEGLNTDRANGLDPRLPLSAGRTLMVKYSHALIW